MSGFGHDTTTSEVLEGIDLSGKIAFVTGASGGLGAETARALAEKGARVTIACRDIPKGEGVAAQIKESTGNDAIDVDNAIIATGMRYADRPRHFAGISSEQIVHFQLQLTGLLIT